MATQPDVPEDISTITENAGELVTDILTTQDNPEVYNKLDPQELRLLQKCKTKSFELYQMLTDLKSKIRLRNRMKKKPSK